jgi:PIN domain nuclease of toxin-antitoxin system
VKLLLDTHALLWWLSDDDRLGPEVREHIADPANEVLVSVASLWEIVVKVRIGKLDVDIGAVERVIAGGDFERLAITPAHLALLAELPAHHRDPFDHLLIAQAISTDSVVVTDDRRMPLYPVQTMRCGRA